MESKHEGTFAEECEWSHSRNGGELLKVQMGKKEVERLASGTGARSGGAFIATLIIYIWPENHKGPLREYSSKGVKGITSAFYNEPVFFK